MRATAEVLLQNQLSMNGIDKSGLDSLIAKVLSFEHISELSQLKGLSVRRQPVFIGGLAIVAALFESLDIETMQVSSGALREGMVYDLSGRLGHDNIRERTIKKLSSQFEIDNHQVERLKTLVKTLLEASNLTLRNDQKLLLDWAIRLHELGLSISHSQFENHAAYILIHADMPGFSRQEQLKLATLVALQRRKIKQDWLDQLTDYQFKTLLPLIVILRLGVLLCRSRTEQNIEGLNMKLNFNEIIMDFPQGWLSNHPLSKADLDSEKKYLRSLKLYLNFD